jgi:acetyl-CoA carboxylase biotin carboxyl carrier protein
MNLKEVEELIRFVSKANVSEVELETKDVKLIIKTSKGYTEQRIETPVIVSTPQPAVAPVQVAAAPVKSAIPAPEAPKAEAKGGDESKFVTIKSPMIGTFYRSSGPDKPPFANVGDKVEKGKIICIIEAMKLFNEIECEVSGTIVKVLVNDASPIEYDQPIFLVNPS